MTDHEHGDHARPGPHGHGADEGHGHTPRHPLTGDDHVDWDAVYDADGGDAPIWSGRPNGSLVVEVADLPPGSALDVGCGEGGDAVWLAARGWRVTAVEPSAVALGRAERAAEAAGVTVTWVHAGLRTVPGGTGQHDLVSAQYPALRLDDGDPVGALMAAVAPGGTLLVVHHAVDAAAVADHGFDHAAYVQPADVAARLDDAWVVEVDETRPRPDAPADALHVRDVVLRARRVR